MRKERNYACTDRGEEGREEASGGEREQRRKVEEQLREDLGGREIGREGNFKGGTLEDTGQYATVHKTIHNTALALDTLVSQIKK